MNRMKGIESNTRFQIRYFHLHFCKRLLSDFRALCGEQKMELELDLPQSTQRTLRGSNRDERDRIKYKITNLYIHPQLCKRFLSELCVLCG